jgi:hypothetical protein
MAKVLRETFRFRRYWWRSCLCFDRLPRPQCFFRTRQGNGVWARVGDGLGTFVTHCWTCVYWHSNRSSSRAELGLSPSMHHRNSRGAVVSPVRLQRLCFCLWDRVSLRQIIGHAIALHSLLCLLLHSLLCSPYLTPSLHLLLTHSLSHSAWLVSTLLLFNKTKKQGKRAPNDQSTS